MNTSTTMLAALPVDHRARLMEIAREVAFPAGRRIFEEEIGRAHV